MDECGLVYPEIRGFKSCNTFNLRTEFPTIK
jgi:hypothetical protein